MVMLYSQMVKMNDNYLGSVIKVRLFNHSISTISPTVEKLANGMENKALVGEYWLELDSISCYLIIVMNIGCSQ
jgi:hypothetical protein